MTTTAPLHTAPGWTLIDEMAWIAACREMDRLAAARKAAAELRKERNR